MRKFLLGIVVLAVSGCVHREYPRFEQQTDAATARQLFAPLEDGQRGLAAVLRQLPGPPMVFQLSSNGARLVEAPQQEQWWAEDHAIFFHGEGSDLYYFDPRSLRLTALAPGATDGSDLVQREPGVWSVFRAVPQKSELDWDPRKLQLTRYDFCGDPAAGLRCSEVCVLSSEAGDSLPVPVPAAQQVVFLHAESEGRARLMIAGTDGLTRHPLLAQQDFDVRYPALLAHQQLVFAANPEGYYKFYTCALDGSGFAPFTGNAAAPHGPERLVLAGTFAGGAVMPAILELPEALDLKTLYALTRAHNTGVNKQRALLAAAMIEARQACLANYPSVSFGLQYTPAVGAALPKPKVFSGDILEQALARGILGLLQPLLDFKYNAAMSAAAEWRVRIARDVLQDEINERLAEAAGLYFEARYLQKLAAFETQGLAACAERLAHLNKLRDQSEACRLQILAATKVQAGLQAEQRFHAERLAFVLARLKEVSGLPERLELKLSSEEFVLEHLPDEEFAQLREIALLNNPRLHAARAALSRAFFVEQGGPAQRATAYLWPQYGQTRRNFGTAVDDYVTVVLSGQWPTMGFKAEELHHAYWREMANSLRLDEEAQARHIAVQLQEALLDFRAAQADCQAKAADLEYAAEQLRVSRLHHQVETPPSFAMFNTPDPLAVYGARLEYLLACARAQKVRMELGQRYAKLWRELGLAEQMPERSRRWSAPEQKRHACSLWVWNTEELVQKDSPLKQFDELTARVPVWRIYLYLGAEGGFLQDPTLHSRIRMLLNHCAAQGLEVWGLLGEPEWLEKGDSAALDRALAHILEFNGATAELEPRLAGVKLDLEPHSGPGWGTDPARRASLSGNYLQLLKQAHKVLAGKLPLWADVPVKLFAPDEHQLREDVCSTVDGLTLMCYFNAEAPLLRWASEALKGTNLPLEVGLELSESAKAEESLARMPRAGFEQLRARLLSELFCFSNFNGLALHDLPASIRFFSQKE